MLDNLTLMIKPLTECNLNCVYCYDKESRSKDRMSLEMVEDICKFAKKSSKCVHWIWHGGEPLLMGYEFLDEAFKILDRYGIDSKIIQTNATLLTEDLSRLLDRNNCSVGFSFDGICNDKTRAVGNIVLENINKFKSITKTNPGCIKVINPDNVHSMASDYDYIKSLGIHAMHYNKVFYAKGVELLDGEYVDVFKEQFALMFDKWVNDSDPLFIRNFDEYINYILGAGSCLCEYKGDCLGQYFSVSPRGDIYPCDRFVPYEWIYGNIKDISSVDDILNTDIFKEHTHVLKSRKNHCKNDLNCYIFDFCNGGCHSSAIASTGGFVQNENECMLKRIEFNHFYNFLKNADIKNIKNPDLKNALIKCGFRNLKLIKENNEQ